MYGIYPVRAVPLTSSCDPPSFPIPSAPDIRFAWYWIDGCSFLQKWGLGFPSKVYPDFLCFCSFFCFSCRFFIFLICVTDGESFWIVVLPSLRTPLYCGQKLAPSLGPLVLS